MIRGKEITAEKRQEMFGRVSGGTGSMNPEHYQRRVIIEKTGLECGKTHIRINLRTIELEVIQKLPKVERFDYTEDFDGTQRIGDNTIYINLKCVAGMGGSQTRTLRDVYSFIKGQLSILLKGSALFFANVLDGDEADRAMGCFQYLLSQPEYSMVRHKVYVGDLVGYIEWVDMLKLYNIDSGGEIKYKTVIDSDGDEEIILEGKNDSFS